MFKFLYKNVSIEYINRIAFNIYEFGSEIYDSVISFLQL